MPKNLANLIIKAIEDLDRIRGLQQILEICSNEFYSGDENAYDRVQLLISLYQGAFQSPFEHLKDCLEEIQQVIGKANP